MSNLVEYDNNSRPQWFKLRNIKYCLRDSVIVNGEDFSVFYALILEIRKYNQILVKWFYLPSEMVLSKSEKASLHPNEIFITDCSDLIDVESIQMKAAIFHTKGFAPPKKIPQEWMILRRKYNPYKNTIRSINLVTDDLLRVEKLNVSLCEPDNAPAKKTPSSKIQSKEIKSKPSAFLDSDVEISFSKSLHLQSSSDDNARDSKLSTPLSSASTRSKAGSKSSYFYMSSEDFPTPPKPTEPKPTEPKPMDSKPTEPKPTEPKPTEPKPTVPKPTERKPTETPKRKYPSRSSTGQNSLSTSKLNSSSSSEQTSKTNTQSISGYSKSVSLANSKVKKSSGRSTRLTSELETLSLSSPPTKSSAAELKSPISTTRFGRAVKPVNNYHCLQKSLAIEALMRSNLLEQNNALSSSESHDDNEISFKENKEPKLTPTLKKARVIKKKKKKVELEVISSESSGEDYTAKKKNKSSNIKTPKRTPLAPKCLKPASVSTPCVVPMRKTEDKQDTAYSLARSRLHVSAVPETLPCREDQFADIYYFLETKLEEKSGGCMYISGVPGTGKTATVRDVLTHINDGDYDYQMIEINGMKLSDPKQLYSLIYRHLEGKKVTPDHGNLLLSDYFGHNEKKSIVLVVDELDLLWTRKQHVMYNLFDWPNRANSKLVVIAIANTMDLPERMLMNKVASRLGLTRMTFQPYSHKQLLEIINSRLEGTTAFAPEACMLAARKVAAASGDARRALDICRHAIDIAEQDKVSTVTSLHIQKAITNMYQSAKTRAIMNCTLYQKIFLKSVLGVFRRKGVEEAVFKEVYEVFCSLCQFQGIFCPPCGAMLQLCVELGGNRILLVEQGSPTLHTHIRLNCAQDDVVFALKEGN